MFKINDKRGLMIFGVLILVFLTLSIAAYMTSGHMGIEERFNNAVGIHADSEEEGSSGIFGFNIEGNLVSYAIIVFAFIIICAVLYIRSKL
ncbi:MAG: hypothetical protein M0Q13_11400 [Methanothrix sp.]|jgi:hypothetical protein|nr:hypothetical protein [Methanothrix sp.]